MFDLFVQNNFPNNAQTKIYQAESDSPRQILLCRGLRSFWGAPIRTGIDFLVSQGIQADMRALDNIVLGRTSNKSCSLYTFND